MLKISTRNSKLAKTQKKIKKLLEDSGTIAGFSLPLNRYKIASFNLPAGAYNDSDGKKHVVCIGAKACLDLCYARQGRYKMGSVISLRKNNHMTLVSAYIQNGIEGMVTLLTEAVESLPRTYGIIRIHDSGDFFSKAYLEAWLIVIRRFPHLLFYAYTKSAPLFDGMDIPENFRVTFSMGGKFDSRVSKDAPISMILKDESELETFTMVDGNDSDLPAILGLKRIGLVYHGVRKPTEENFVNLRA